MNPDFVIVGAQKAGSTALMTGLSLHPSVCIPRGETRYFRDPWFQFQTREDLEAQVAADNPRVIRRGIKSPDLLGLPEAPRRLKDTLTDPDIVAILRKPLERAVSSYFWLMQWGFLPIEEPEVGLRAILRDEWVRDYPRSKEVLTFGTYGEHLQRYEEHFSWDRIFTMLTDDFQHDPQREFDRLTRFLGVESLPLASFSKRVNSGVYSLRRLRFLSRRHKHLLRAYPGYEGRFIQEPDSFGDQLRDISIAAWDRLVLARVWAADRPTLSRGLRADLIDYYEEDLVMLESLIERDLSAWRMV